jgi:hypothetical protein
VRAVFVLLTAYAILNKLADLVLHVQELVVSLNEFHCSRNTRVSMQQVVVVTANDVFFQFLWYLYRDLLVLRDAYNLVELLGWSK